MLLLQILNSLGINEFDEIDWECRYVDDLIKEIDSVLMDSQLSMEEAVEVIKRIMKHEMKKELDSSRGWY